MCLKNNEIRKEERFRVKVALNSVKLRLWYSPLDSNQDLAGYKPDALTITPEEQERVYLYHP